MVFLYDFKLAYLFSFLFDKNASYHLDRRILCSDGEDQQKADSG